MVRFCEQIGKRLTALSGDFEGRRRILDLLVDKIVVRGKTVRIRGAIPAVPAKSNQDPCRIASITSS